MKDYSKARVNPKPLDKFELGTGELKNQGILVHYSQEHHGLVVNIGDKTVEVAPFQFFKIEEDSDELYVVTEREVRRYTTSATSTRLKKASFLRSKYLFEKTSPVAFSCLGFLFLFSILFHDISSSIFWGIFLAGFMGTILATVIMYSKSEEETVPITPDTKE